MTSVQPATEVPRNDEAAVLRVLAVEDSPADALLLREMLRDSAAAAVELRVVPRLSAAIEVLLDGGVDCVLLDLSLPDADGLDGLAQVRTVAYDVPIIVFSGRTDERLAVRAVQAGAQDYLIKGQTESHLLARAIHYAVERKRAEAAIVRQALHDDLTGLPNRALFSDRLGQALTRLGRTSTALGVLFLDLDRFKVVNDSLGHAAGDQLLAEAGNRLLSSLRAGDTAARFGGDEFVVLCEDISGEHQAVAVAERIADALGAPFLLDDELEVHLRISIGLAMATEPATRAEAVVRDADAAMYRAKERGGGTLEVFDDAMRGQAARRLALETALHWALERGEFVLHFQPQRSLADATIVGVEALARWRHPERGLVAPEEFLGAAQDSGLMVPLGAWILREACARAAEWAGVPIVVSVNLTPRELGHPEFVETVRRTLAATGAPPASLRLEIAEEALVDDADNAAAVLAELTEIGVGVAVDGFGSGVSSLAALKRFPFDAVKIDRALVGGLEDDPEAGVMIAAIIGLAGALGLSTVAEGVETEGQLERLRALGCGAAQGFHLHPPVPAAELAGLAG
jgi:diguanylate cyclase (GGDEF)-like protein